LIHVFILTENKKQSHDGDKMADKIMGFACIHVASRVVKILGEVTGTWPQKKFKVPLADFRSAGV